jgi:hypothetical protein
MGLIVSNPDPNNPCFCGNQPVSGCDSLVASSETDDYSASNTPRRTSLVDPTTVHGNPLDCCAYAWTLALPGALIDSVDTPVLNVYYQNAAPGDCTWDYSVVYGQGQQLAMVHISGTLTIPGPGQSGQLQLPINFSSVNIATAQNNPLPGWQYYCLGIVADTPWLQQQFHISNIANPAASPTVYKMDWGRATFYTCGPNYCTIYIAETYQDTVNPPYGGTRTETAPYPLSDPTACCTTAPKAGKKFLVLSRPFNNIDDNPQIFVQTIGGQPPFPAPADMHWTYTITGGDINKIYSGTTHVIANAGYNLIITDPDWIYDPLPGSGYHWGLYSTKWPDKVVQSLVTDYPLAYQMWNASQWLSCPGPYCHTVGPIVSGMAGDGCQTGWSKSEVPSKQLIRPDHCDALYFIANGSSDGNFAGFSIEELYGRNLQSFQWTWTLSLDGVVLFNFGPANIVNAGPVADLIFSQTGWYKWGSVWRYDHRGPISANPVITSSLTLNEQRCLYQPAMPYSSFQSYY